MSALEELIWLRDKNGDRKELTPADIPLIKSILKKHLGSKAEIVWGFWTKGRGENSRTMSEFLNSLNEFNSRRKYVIASDGKLINNGHQAFLVAKYQNFLNNNLQELTKLNPELFLGSKVDFAFMNIVFKGLHWFDLSNL